MALKERYESIHKIRERVQSIGFWSLGLLLSASSWLFTSDMVFSIPQRFLLIFFIGISFYSIRFVYLKDLCKGFKNQQKVASHIEETLGLFDIGLFDNTDMSIYPEKWKKIGTDDGDGNFFTSTYNLLNIGVASIIISILLNGYPCF